MKSGLETKVRTSKNEERSQSSALRYLPNGGIEIELPLESAPILTVGSTIAIEMAFRGEVVQRGARVVAVRENRCGLAFLSPQDENSQRQAARTRGIVLSLQQLWLKSRLA